jgi:hypothetical protein
MIAFWKHLTAEHFFGFSLHLSLQMCVSKYGSSRSIQWDAWLVVKRMVSFIFSTLDERKKFPFFIYILPGQGFSPKTTGTGVYIMFTTPRK